MSGSVRFGGKRARRDVAKSEQTAKPARIRNKVARSLDVALNRLDLHGQFFDQIKRFECFDAVPRKRSADVKNRGDE